MTREQALREVDRHLLQALTVATRHGMKGRPIEQMKQAHEGLKRDLSTMAGIAKFQKIMDEL